MNNFRCIAGCCIAACLASCDARPKNATPAVAATRPASPATQVTTVKPVRKTLEVVTTQPGWTRAWFEAPLHSKLAAYVAEVLVDIGDRVQQHQVLIELFVPEMHDDVRQKEALVVQADAAAVQAEAALQSAEAAVKTADARVASAQSGLIRAEGEYERWRSENDRMRQLAQNGSVSVKLADETRNQFRAADSGRDEATAQVATAESALVEARARVAVARAEVGVAAAHRQVALTNHDYSRTLLSYALIKAPFYGVITNRIVDPGHYVQPADGATTHPLLTVAETDMIRVFVEVPEHEAALVDPGDKALVRVEASSRGEIRAAVTRTSWNLDPANRALKTEIDVPNTKGLLRPGMYAIVSIVLARSENALVLPATAIVQQQGRAVCWCIASGRAHRRSVTLGLTTADEVEVTQGLTGDDLVVRTPDETLVEDAQVDAISSHSP